MKQLIHSTSVAKTEERRGAISRYAPLVAAISGAALFFSAGEADAQQARKSQCSASLVSGTISSYSTKAKAARILNQPTIERGKYVQLTIPNSYVDELIAAAKARPEGERSGFVRDAVTKTLEVAMAQMGGSSTKVTLECPAVESLAAVPLPAPAKAAPPQPAPEKAAPPQPVPEPGKAQPVPDEEKRRRVIQPGGGSPKPAQKPQAAKQSLPPLPGQIKGGDGSDKRPYDVMPARNRTTGNGMGAAKVDIPFVLDIEGVGRIHFKVHFSLSQLTRKNQNDALSEVRDVFRSAILRKALEKGESANNTAVRDFSRNMPAQFSKAIKSVEASDPEVADYIGSN